METSKRDKQDRWRNDALDLYFRSFDIPCDDCNDPAASGCTVMVVMCRFYRDYICRYVARRQGLQTAGQSRDVPLCQARV